MIFLKGPSVAPPTRLSWFDLHTYGDNGQYQHLLLLFQRLITHKRICASMYLFKQRLFWGTDYTKNRNNRVNKCMCVCLRMRELMILALCWTEGWKKVNRQLEGVGCGDISCELSLDPLIICHTRHALNPSTKHTSTFTLNISPSLNELLGTKSLFDGILHSLGLVLDRF